MKNCKKLLVIFQMLCVFSSLFASETGEEEILKNLQKHLTFLTSKKLEGRKSGKEGAKLTADYIYKQFEEIGLNPERERAYKDKYQNIVGRIPSEYGKYIVIGAHYDGIGKRLGEINSSADDNASGVAVLIELARLLVKENLQYGVEFVAFDCGVSTLYGSGWNAAQKLNYDHECVLMLNIDMVGHFKDEGRIIYEGTETIVNGEKLVRDSMIDNMGVKTYPFVSEKEYRIDTFYYDKKHISTINITTGIESSHIYSVEDTLSTLDINGMEKITRQISVFVKNIQGKVESTGNSMYEDLEVEVGFQTALKSGIGLFVSIPLYQGLTEKYYIKPIIRFSGDTLYDNEEKILTEKLLFELPIMSQSNVYNSRYVCGLGPFYENCFKNNVLKQTVGILENLEMRAKSNTSSLGNMYAIGVDVFFNCYSFYDKSKYNFKEDFITLDAYLCCYF